MGNRSDTEHHLIQRMTPTMMMTRRTLFVSLAGAPLLVPSPTDDRALPGLPLGMNMGVRHADGQRANTAEARPGDGRRLATTQA